jgi:hypothetical protein
LQRLLEIAEGKAQLARRDLFRNPPEHGHEARLAP